MARKARVEVEGGLYHVITRGNGRQDIFHSDEDFRKFLLLLETQKARLPFYLYAYCLMTNHVHLLIERRSDAVGRIMHRVLTGYSQYYNRRYRKVGHLLEGRHKAILCQSEMYMGELVRYIHLNPVRSMMVEQPEDYLYSSQREYLGIEPAGMVDVDPMLRLFGPKRVTARKRFAEFVQAGIGQGHREDLYKAEDGQILGTEEFVDATIHRLGDIGRAYRPTDGRLIADADFNPEALIAAVEGVSGTARTNFYGSAKSRKTVVIKELLIVSGRQAGATVKTLSEMTGLNSSTVSRRHDAATNRMHEDQTTRQTVNKVLEKYREQIAILQA